ncbi:ABC transporter substrate-binding protein [Rubripirellula amarantea]|uniref:Extracellular solute-binding protein n=1 Tax=Rubripirellula amarantea TaxID=2527999 RepID=A0A5C5WRW0_9BACT|nr:ABC transporter substrate-binding protein [Rubripirellula amarantea]MDA8744474.1 ABC transporter substrate-binding protein [Rubripirellula amarantea]TWT53297.1 Extracellular solute-binding protein [Rubripirellula amarantea]
MRKPIYNLSLILLVFALSGVLGGKDASAQLLNFAQEGMPEEPGLALLQEEPHDIIYFTEKSGGGWCKAHLLDFPGRKPPSSPSGSVKFQVLGVEGKDLTCKWSDIERIDLWEVRLEREAKERIAKADFVGAYPFLSVLIRDFPNRPGLRKLRSEFIWKDAISRAKKQEWASTLAMLEELKAYDPSFERSKVIKAMSGVIDRLMKGLVEDGKLDLARQLLTRIESDYPNEKIDAVKKWNDTFMAMAKAKQDQAIAAFKEKDYRSARRFIRESAYVEPNLEGNTQLLRQIQNTYPLVNVGVLQSATVFEPTRIDNWAARRAGRLLYRTVFEIQGAGPEGGEYSFIFGDTEMNPNRMQFDLMLTPQELKPPLDQIQGYYLADVMARRAQKNSSEYFSPWAAAVETIALDGPQQISFNLRRPHVLPICLLQIPVDGSWFGGEPGSPTGDYRTDLVEDDYKLVRYVLSGKPKTENQPREIVENRLDSGAEGVGQLLRGELDVLDQLFPADAVRLRKSRNVKVVNYPLPTVHMLVPCSDHPYLAERTFRRALVYGINREDILKGELLEGLDFEGCRVLSGPFPAGIELNDPLGYAYDRNIKPRNYEPPLAKLLLAMNKNQMESMAQRKKEEVPELTPIRLAFPSDNMSRVACEAIRSQWELIGLEVELVELPVGRTFPNSDEDIADIVYVSAAVWEPVIDARRVLGPEGLAKSNDQLVGLGLRRIEEAKNWREVRDGLISLHAISHHELPIIPLWQMVDSYAYRRDLIGMGSDIVSLYQNADNWRIGN